MAMNAKEILDATVFGGATPTRFSNNYEALQLMFHPLMINNPSPQPGQENIVDLWGVTNSWPAGVPGQFPVHTPDKVVIKDFECWQDYVKAPCLDFPQEQWDMFKAQYDAVDKTQTYVAPFIAPGIFERMHHLGKIDEVLVALYEFEDECHDLVKYITEWELKLAETICSNLHPEAIFHHDDWGSMTSTFMSPDMFDEFFLDAYKEVYGYYKSHGVKLVAHHSDSYGATLVPSMIEMGIDIWQGCMSSNNMPEMVHKYGDKITFMGGFDGAMIDRPDWTPELIHDKVYEMLDAVGTTRGFIPCIAQGGPGSVYPGVYNELVKAIDQYSIEKLGAKEEEITRLPLQIMF